METQVKPSTQAPKNKRVIWLAIILVVAVAAGVAMLLMSMNGSSAPENATQGEVTVTGQRVEPETVAIKRGQAITWRNQGDTGFQLKSDNLPDLSTEESVTPGESFSFTFDDPGTFSYYDPSNPTQVKGTIVVE